MHPERRPNPDRSPESLEARLRALPPPPVPADLEARLLAAIPAQMPLPQRRWAVWAGMLGPLAAACLLVVLAWPGRDRQTPVPSPAPRQSQQQATPQPRDDRAGIAALLKARRDLDEAEPPTFTWPLETTSPAPVSTSIPPDLLE
jgi:hypothetical protein